MCYLFEPLKRRVELLTNMNASEVIDTEHCDLRAKNMRLSMI